ncbi:MAG: sterol desaturase family protein [Bacteroidota bacterium]
MELVYGRGLLLILLFIVTELLYLRFVRKESIPWKELVLNANSGHILLLVLRGLNLLVYTGIYQHIGWGGFQALPEIWQWVITVILWDFFYYWSHRMHHEIPFLWNIHSVHHQGEHYSLSLGIRNSWLQTLTASPFFIPLALLGVPTELFIAVSAVNFMIQFYNHNRIVNKSGVLEYFMVTPSHHRVHHGSNPEYLDKNHGGSLVIWDKIFGTFKKEDPNINIRYGTVEKVHTQSPFWANAIPFFQYFKLHLKERAVKKQYDYPSLYIASGGLVLFMLLIYYVYAQHNWPVAPLAILFGTIFLGTLFLGGIADKKRSSMIAWALISLGAGVGLMIQASILSGLSTFSVIAFSSLLLHGLLAIPQLLWIEGKERVEIC